MSQDELALLENADFWRALLPDFNISDNVFQQDHTTNIDVDLKAIQDARRCIEEEGYLLLDSVLPLNVTSMLAEGVTRLVAKGVLPVFAYLYDDYC